jgi:hypothetical protein
MSWQEVVAVAVVLLGLGTGAFLVGQRLSSWNEFGQRLGESLLSLTWRFVSMRMQPDEEAAWRQVEMRERTGSLAGRRNALVLTLQHLDLPKLRDDRLGSPRLLRHRLSPFQAIFFQFAWFRKCWLGLALCRFLESHESVCKCHWPARYTWTIEADMFRRSACRLGNAGGDAHTAHAPLTASHAGPRPHLGGMDTVRAFQHRRKNLTLGYFLAAAKNGVVGCLLRQHRQRGEQPTQTMSETSSASELSFQPTSLVSASA